MKLFGFFIWMAGLTVGAYLLGFPNWHTKEFLAICIVGFSGIFYGTT